MTLAELIWHLQELRADEELAVLACYLPASVVGLEVHDDGAVRVIEHPDRRVDRAVLEDFEGHCAAVDWDVVCWRYGRGISRHLMERVANTDRRERLVQLLVDALVEVLAPDPQQAAVLHQQLQGFVTTHAEGLDAHTSVLAGPRADHRCSTCGPAPAAGTGPYTT